MSLEVSQIILHHKPFQFLELLHRLLRHTVGKLRNDLHESRSSLHIEQILALQQLEHLQILRWDLFKPAQIASIEKCGCESVQSLIHRRGLLIEIARDVRDVLNHAAGEQLDVLQEGRIE